MAEDSNGWKSVRIYVKRSNSLPLSYHGAFLNGFRNGYVCRNHERYGDLSLAIGAVGGSCLIDSKGKEQLRLHDYDFCIAVTPDTPDEVLSGLVTAIENARPYIVQSEP